MNKCLCTKKTKHLPFGARRGKYWCLRCDANLVGDHLIKPIKKSFRQKNKTLIQKELLDYLKTSSKS